MITVIDSFVLELFSNFFPHGNTVNLWMYNHSRNTYPKEIEILHIQGNENTASWLSSKLCTSVCECRHMRECVVVLGHTLVEEHAYQRASIV